MPCSMRWNRVIPAHGKVLTGNLQTRLAPFAPFGKHSGFAHRDSFVQEHVDLVWVHPGRANFGIWEHPKPLLLCPVLPNSALGFAP